MEVFFSEKHMVNSSYTWSSRECPQNTDHIYIYIYVIMYNAYVLRLMIEYTGHRSYHTHRFTNKCNCSIRTLLYNFHSNESLSEYMSSQRAASSCTSTCFHEDVPASVGQCVRVTRMYLKYKSSSKR